MGEVFYFPSRHDNYRDHANEAVRRALHVEGMAETDIEVVLENIADFIDLMSKFEYPLTIPAESFDAMKPVVLGLRSAFGEFLSDLLMDRVLAEVRYLRMREGK